ncbi:MAG: tripartite tricarboxylate transporter TctB family protein [Candidatus Competibacteraceae bacterium]|nr:tripartite tricarboxylate transporter TctB family protein [Candidatus Competibacteraceae bacterium]
MRYYRQDVVAGLLMALFALAVIIHVTINGYALGSFSHMGPGMFPTLTAAILALVGILIATNGLRAARIPLPHVPVRPAIAIIAGIACFAILVPIAGVIPGGLGLVLVTAFAEKRVSWAKTMFMAIMLCGAALLVFKFLLNLPLQLLPGVY